MITNETGMNLDSGKNIPSKTSTIINYNVCDLRYLIEMMGGKKVLIREIIDVFLNQVPEELEALNNAIMATDYSTIRNFSHTMKSSVSIMGISSLTSILQQMEDLGTKQTDINSIKLLFLQLNSICTLAIEELEIEKLKFD